MAQHVPTWSLHECECIVSVFSSGFSEDLRPAAEGNGLSLSFPPPVTPGVNTVITGETSTYCSEAFFYITPEELKMKVALFRITCFTSSSKASSQYRRVLDHYTNKCHLK